MLVVASFMVMAMMVMFLFFSLFVESSCMLMVMIITACLFLSTHPIATALRFGFLLVIGSIRQLFILFLVGVHAGQGFEEILGHLLDHLIILVDLYSTILSISARLPKF